MWYHRILQKRISQPNSCKPYRRHQASDQRVSPYGLGAQKFSRFVVMIVFFEERCKLCMVKVGCSWILPQIVYLKSQPKLILGVKPSSLSTGSKQRIIETNSRSAGSVKKTFTLGSPPFVGPQTTRYMNFPASCRSGQIAGGPKDLIGIVQKDMCLSVDYFWVFEKTWAWARKCEIFPGSSWSYTPHFSPFSDSVVSS